MYFIKIPSNMYETVGVEIKQEQDPPEIFPEQDSLDVPPEIMKTDLDDIVKSEGQYSMTYDENCSNKLSSENGLFLKEENVSFGVTEKDSINKIDIDQHEFPADVILKCKGDYESPFKQRLKEEQRTERRENDLDEKFLLKIFTKAVTDLKTEIDLDNIVVKNEDQFLINCDENSSNNLPSENGLVLKDCPSVEAVQSLRALESEYKCDVVKNLVKKIDYDHQDVVRQTFFQENVELPTDVTKLKRVEKKKKAWKKGSRNNTSVSKKKKRKCHYCDYETQYTSHLKGHVSAIHEKGKVNKDKARKQEDKAKASYKCPGCHRGFDKIGQLYIHLLKNHDNLHHLIRRKIHYCKFCAYKTMNSNHLTYHEVRIHYREGAEKFQCHKCDYFALDKSYLRRHVLVHSNLKPYLCTACQHGFSQKTALDCHILRKHKENADLLKCITCKIQQCTFCIYKTINKYDLHRHMKNKHKQTSTYITFKAKSTRK